MQQTIITPENGYSGLEKWMVSNSANQRLLLVHDDSLRFMPVFEANLEAIAKEHGIEIVRFHDFQPNPRYESVLQGVSLLRDNACTAIMAVGGGSAIDVAKCIKLFSGMEGDGANGGYLNHAEIPNGLGFLAMPTTAGTGSEATRYAVVYYEGNKQSITSESFIPDTVLLDAHALQTLPLYQKKATMMDALCHAIESYWSVNSNETSKVYSKEAIQGILAHMEGYLENTEEGNAGMLMAAHIAGKAINITQTTAGHAMCYKITSLFGCAHGHAAILCDRVLFPWMVKNTYRCVDPRGKAYLERTLDEIGQALGCKDAQTGAEKLTVIFKELKLEVPSATAEQYESLITGVNPVRLKNHPIRLDNAAIGGLYHRILR